jgi:hypothetical protein
MYLLFKMTKIYFDFFLASACLCSLGMAATTTLVLLCGGGAPSSLPVPTPSTTLL